MHDRAETQCSCCGHATVAGPCQRCRGTLTSLHRHYALRPGLGAPPADLWRGGREVYRAVFALLHERAFIGRLRLPVAANLLAFLLVYGAGGWLLATSCHAAFATPWPLLDGVRQALADEGPARWLAATALLLGPPLLDVIAGALQEPLRAATELAMLGPERGPDVAHGMLRLRERAQVLAAAIVALPLVLGLVLVPWIWLPLLLVLGSAAAAVVWFEPPMAERGLRLPARLALLWRNRWRALGVGCGLQLAVGVPFVNVLALAPIATIAATSAYLQFDKQPPRRPPTAAA